VAADAQREPRRGDKPFGAAEIEAAALSYLNRFDATAKKLSDHLMRLARRRGCSTMVALPLIESLLLRYRESGLIDDRRFARARAATLQTRGSSRRMISLKLVQSGVAREIVDEVLREGGGSNELDAATAYVKRKRLGRFRVGTEQPDARRKDLARLARQGFDFDTASRALGFGGDEDF
jgi:regulatory protein